ncbi:unnamed protein product [Amoebophrya sp. A120]|nr:unnamed protein product [Amoebophrya sp. A120]|eukprot:GSA120T00003398001.1
MDAKLVKVRMLLGDTDRAMLPLSAQLASSDPQYEGVHAVLSVWLGTACERREGTGDAGASSSCTIPKGVNLGTIKLSPAAALVLVLTRDEDDAALVAVSYR